MRRILIIGEWEEFLPLFTRLVDEYNNHIWFATVTQHVEGLIKEHDINLVLINITERNKTRYLCQGIRSNEITKKVDIIFYKSQEKHGAINIEIDELLESSFNFQDVKNFLLKETNQINL